ncbi:hypothetical protein [Bradyrhizobium sp. Ash2021]|uniref:hypothetical protein n=1 Tax=Bradyrhizobium sp. Ash2021 TaxID=2954771 RepID=UPI0028157910|nr:hypothetical protein [Bradyrhizobium sp. Ash2021]WMT71918.1 hypothetical protein NL528_28070 [Bradyrhizobium sp. Ash2021]
MFTRALATANFTRFCEPIFTFVRDEVGPSPKPASCMQLRSFILSVLFMIAFGLPAIAQSERAALVDFNNGDKRSDGTVAWRTEQVKTSDGRDDLAIRADVDIPGRNLKLTMTLRRNLDPSVPASHLIELTFTVPPDFIDGGMGDAFFMFLGPKEMSVAGGGLLGSSFKTRVDGQYVEALSDKPDDICRNLAALNENAWLAVYINGAKRKPGVFRPAVSDQSLWFSKGEAGQRVFDAAFAAWEKTSEAGARSTVCHPS